MEKYIKHREKTVGFNFSEDDISYESIETIQNREFIQGYKPYVYDNPDYPFFNLCENEIEQRWLEIENLPDKYIEYDIEGKEGENCEMIVHYIQFGSKYTPNGKLGGHAKDIGILDRFGDFNSSKS